MNETQNDKKTNRLIQSTSPYLQQHAYNPVDWFPWGQEALEKAKNEDKAIIVSIGYSACHWCHVMERESFENEQIAAWMNTHFVCIKVDREERPDVDAIYMDAVQAMGLQGGWPLNAFLTPEAKPFYAGTYFPPQNWFQLLQNIAQVFQNNRKELEESAEQFKEAIAFSEIQKYGLEGADENFSLQDLDWMFNKLAANFDTQRGGFQKAPKFPMPCIYQFLLHYAQLPGVEAEKKSKAKKHVQLTLDEMAKGGIYDQIGGGFARYSVDAEWFAPHFEKMLYDNGQLLSLYADAYNFTGEQGYRQIVYDCVDFIEREMVSEEGAFYSALDADSEGMEGKFYIWTWDELKGIFTEEADFSLFCTYYRVKEEGNWEHTYNILHRSFSDEDFAQQRQISLREVSVKIAQWKKILLAERSQRIRPGLDDKILTSWNALMLKGLTDAYRVFDENVFLDLAVENAYFIKNKLAVHSDNEIKLYRTYKNGQASLDAYLEDYAFLIEAYLSLYQASFDIQWMKEAKKLCNYVLNHFYDTEEGMFYFTDNDSEKLIARKKEIFDNVMPASNSVMAKNLYFLGLFLDEPRYIQIAKKMLAKMRKVMIQNVEYLANWATLYAFVVQPTAEIVLIGEDYAYFRKKIDAKYFPNKIIIGSEKESDDLPLLENRYAIQDETTIYVCYNRSCQLPVNTVEKAWEQIQKMELLAS